ncbi:MAG: SPOR domain-containing protein [Halioglobus sp.]
MNDILKQRLVGALILVALGVVFWPIIFVEPGNIAGEEARRIPARPAVDTTPMPAPDKKGLRESKPLESRKEVQREQLDIDRAQKTAASVPATDSESTAAKTPKPAPPKPVKKTRTEAPIKPAIDSEGVPIAWILQVASVSKSDKAEELRKRLLSLGYKAYVKKIQRSGNSLLRVYVGPKFERAKLEKMKATIDEEFGVKSMVLRYIP